MKPHDILVLEGRMWSVTGDFSGGATEESVIGLQVEGLRLDATAYGQEVRELFVPEILIRRAIEAGILQHIPAGS